MITPSYPKDLSLLGNDLILDLYSDQYYQVNPVAFQVELEFSSIPNDGDTLQLKYSGGTRSYVLFFQSGTAGQGMWQFGLPGSGTVEEYLENHFVPDWKSNLALNLYWSIEYIGSDTVLIDAKLPGEFYQFDTSFSSAFASATVATNAQDGVVFNNLNIYLSLLFRKRGAAIWEERTFRVPTNEGQARYYLNKLLSFDDVDLNLPPFKHVDIQDVSSSILEYKMAFTELFASGLGAGNKLQESSVFRVFPGGVSERDYATFDLQSAIDDDFAWLTNQPDQIRVFPDQQFYIHYYYGNDAKSRHLRAKILCEDGSIEMVSLFSNASLEANQLNRIPLHPQIVIDALNDPGKAIVEYEVFWAETATPDQPIWPQNLKFRLDYDQQEFITELLYLNSYGLFEVMVFHGQRDFRVEHETDYVSQVTPETYSVSTRTSRNFESEIRPFQVLDTGYKTKEEMKLLQELLSSREVYLVEDSYYRPVILKSTSTELFNDRSGRMNNATISLYDQKFEKFFSNGRYSV